MSGPVDDYIQDGVPVDKSAFRADDRTAKRRTLADVDTVRNKDLSGQYGGIYVRSLHANFDLDTGSTAEDDGGTSCITDFAGNIFVRVSGGGDVAGDTHAAPSKATPVDADELPLVDSAASNVLKKLTWANLKAALASTFLTTGAVRERLSADRTCYVRADGSDGNTGLANTSGGAFLTLQKAINTVAALDISIYNVVIQVDAGTYTAGCTVTGPWVGTGTVSLLGDTTTPSNVLISLASGSCILVQAGGRLTVGGFKVATGSGNGVASIGSSSLTISGSMEYGACGFHMATSSYGSIAISASYTISGSATSHHAVFGGFIQVSTGRTVTLTGTPAFTSFANALRGGVLVVVSITYSGAATGSRYAITSGGNIDTNGGGASYLPGNSAGSGGTTAGLGFYT